jgi:hypothetical protein
MKLSFNERRSNHEQKDNDAGRRNLEKDSLILHSVDFGKFVSAII